jgi:hypothetical protein
MWGVRWRRWYRWLKTLGEDESGGRPLARGAMVAGLLAVVVLCLAFPEPRLGTLPPKKLLVIVGGLLFDAIAVSVLVVLMVSGVRMALSKGERRGERLISGITLRATWVTAIWVPAWVFALRMPSLVTVMAGCLLMATATLYLRRHAAVTADAGISLIAQSESQEPGLLTYPSQPDSALWARVLLPSVALALLLELTVTVAAMQRFRWASLLAGAFVAAVMWRLRDEWRRKASNRRAAAALMLAFVFTLVVLLPYLKSTPFSVTIGPMAKLTYGVPPKPGANTDEGWSGIILTSPKQQQKKIEIPVKKEMAPVFSGRLPQAIEIPFDGAYWYFKPPDRKPRPTARVVQGSSLKATVRSTDWYPLIMEAHQPLGTPIDLGCCGGIDIVVQSADRRDGPIALELWVRGKDMPDARGYYLGTATLPSSEVPAATRGNEAAPVEERLSYVVPSRMEGVKFDEIAVEVRSPPSRWREGAKIGIVKFVLEP